MEGMGELHCHQLDTEDKLWNFHLLDRKDKVELSFHLLDRGDKEEPSFHRLDKKDKEELSFHLLDMEDKQEQWQMVDSQDHYLNLQKHPCSNKYSENISVTSIYFSANW